MTEIAAVLAGRVFPVSDQIPRLLFVHAHPDDETLTTGATIAHYASRGAQVHVVTCTLGEEGEVIGDQWAHLSVDQADQLGGYRIGELTAALEALGAGPPRFLGGAGRWRDSGMTGTPPRRRQRFIDAGTQAVATLSSIITALRPHVVVSYDPHGGYGHPDHIQAHRVTTDAVAAAATATCGGAAPWATPKFYWTVTSAGARRTALSQLRDDDLLPQWTLARAEDAAGDFPDDRIDAVIASGNGTADDARHCAKVAAMRAHATQITVGPTGRAFVLSNNIVQPVLQEEHYVLAAGTAGARDHRGWETDLLSGVRLGAG